MKYHVLVAAPGIKLAWDAIPGLAEALGSNGVTSNYRYDLAPYTYQLVRELRRGRALFTQPPMPIKCAGAPQKAMYLSCDIWSDARVLQNIDVEFHNAGAVLFGVPAYVPALKNYIERYGIDLRLESKLVAVDGQRKIATLESKTADGSVERIERSFDLLHAVPPQVAPEFVASSPLAGPGGFIEVDQATLQHVRYREHLRPGRRGTEPATRRRRPPPASKRPWSPSTRWLSWRANNQPQITMATAPALSPSNAARSCSRIWLWRQAASKLPNLADRRHAPEPHRVVPQRKTAAADLLAGNAQGARMDGSSASHRGAGVTFEPLQYFLGAASGSLVGFTLALVGGGGSILAVPLMVYLVGLANPHVAIGTSAFAVAVNAATGLIGHARAHTVKWRCGGMYAPQA